MKRLLFLVPFMSLGTGRAFASSTQAPLVIQVDARDPGKSGSRPIPPPDSPVSHRKNLSFTTGPRHRSHPGEPAELRHLRNEEHVLYSGLLKEKSPEGFHRLGKVRYDIARFKHDRGAMGDPEFRDYLVSQAVHPLRLNLRAWVGQDEDDNARSWQRKSWKLIEQIMHEVKTTVTNIPRRRRKGDVVGRASWYGGEAYYEGEDGSFHEPTSTGDSFCMFGQTCAFLRAPLGSWVRVLNPRNGRWIDLRVNDRGGFERYGKVIDLSRGAYGMLKLANNGTVIVRRIKASEAIREPILCDGKGHFDFRAHLRRTHAAIPRSWKYRMD